MASTTARLVSLVTTLVLSGTPTMLSACAALCLPGMNHATVVAAEAVPPADGAAGAHSHHAATPLSATHHAQHAERPGAAPSAPGAPDAAAGQRATRVAAVDHSCCPDVRTLAVATMTTARVDAGAVLVPGQAARWTLVARTATSAVAVGSPRGALQSPARTPLVLRI